MVERQRLGLGDERGHAGMRHPAAPVRRHHAQRGAGDASGGHRFGGGGEGCVDHAATASPSGRGFARTINGTKTSAATLIVPAMMKKPS